MVLRREIGMAVLLWIGTALGTADATGQVDSRDSLRVKRIAELGRLWSDLEVFHPYLAYRDIDWDAALVAAVTKIDGGSDSEAYASVVQEMLDTLDDPATRVLAPARHGEPSDDDQHPVWFWTPDSLLVVTMTNYLDLYDWQRAGGILKELGQAFDSAKGIVFDLRQLVPGDASIHQIFDDGQVASHLVTKPISSPGERFRLHFGMRRARGAGFGGYYSGFRIVDGWVFEPSDGVVEKPVVFLANGGSRLPEIALALQNGGSATILMEGEPSDAPAITVDRYELPQQIEVAVRRSERVYPDGGVGFVPDSVLMLPSSTSDSISVTLAIDLARAPSGDTGNPTRTTAPFAPQRPQRTYDDTTYPLKGYRILAGVRLWSAVRHFFPHLDLIDEDWDSVLYDFIPRLESASDSLEYALVIAEMVTRIHDSHGFVWAPAFAGSGFGIAPPPVATRMIEGVPVITKILDDSTTRKMELEVGDVVLAVDGEDAEGRMDRYSGILSASTPAAKSRRVMENWLSGAEGSVARLRIRDRNDMIRSVELPRRTAHWSELRRHRSEEILRVLPGNIGYADLDQLTIAMVDSMFIMFRDSPGIIFDMRGHPRGTAWSIAPRLTDQEHVPTNLYREQFAMGPDTTESVEMRSTGRLPDTDKERYTGHTVMLIDERTISQGEGTGLMFKAANGTVFIGSSTMGANGEVTNLVLPGDIFVTFSGAEFLYPDGRQFQRVGLIPDVHVEPTLNGIRAGRDEVLEQAIHFLNGD